MTTTDDLVREVEQEQAAQESKALTWLHELAVINEELGPLNKRKSELTDALKQWMALNALEVLADLELGISAKLQERKGTPVYDLVSAVNADNWDALVEAARAGMARLDHSMLSKFRKDAGASWADTLARYEMPGTGTVALVIEKTPQ